MTNLTTWKINDAALVPYLGGYHIGRVIAIIEDGRIVAEFMPHSTYVKEIEKNAGSFARVLGYWRRGVSGWFSSEPEWVFCPSEL